MSIEVVLVELEDTVVEVVELIPGPTGPPGPAGEGLDPDQQAALDGNAALNAGNYVAGIDDIVPLPDTVTQVAAEAGTATAVASWTAQRVWQAITAWGINAASVFSGILSGYTEASTTPTWTAGALTLDHSIAPNIIYVTEAEALTLTITNKVKGKPLTIWLTQHATGPFTLTVIDGLLTLAVTLDAVAGGVELVEFNSDGVTFGQIYNGLYVVGV